jgi:hypothetical protein
VRFTHPDYPVFADLSIVKKSKTVNKVEMPCYTIQEAGVFNNPEFYEVELEIDNSRVGTGTPYSTTKELIEVLRKCISIILSALQCSKYPISLSERNAVYESYMKLLYGEDSKLPDNFERVKTKYFIGPASFTLQTENIIPVDEESTVPNIRNQYTVTDKADGDRKLLYIDNEGKIYFIDINMNVQFTGALTIVKKLFNTLIDGEHIKYDKNQKYINLYAAFDIYYVNKKSVREYAFISKQISETDNKYRLAALEFVIDNLKPISATGKVDSKTPADIRIQRKSFEIADENYSIFRGCSKILSQMKDGLFEYNTDGLIFTPMNAGVGSDRAGIACKLEKTTWERSFKWKPPEFNTIDFLVYMKKDKTGRDEIHHVFQDGKNLQGAQEVVQYKTLELRCGFNPRDHGFLNPYQDVIDDNLPSPDDIDNEQKYQPVPFVPTNPYDEKACYCNIMLKQDGTNLYMMTEEQEYFEEDMIVEFKYEPHNEDGWKWVPLRVRYDKTADLRSGRPNYGNAYHVANNNWHSIHHPITESMLMTGENIPDYGGESDIYYNRSTKGSSTEGLRNFHNLYVKKKLITGVSKRGDLLMDYAVGKAGDLSKWIHSHLKFVFGVDYSKDNIHNHMDGACARFLKEKKKHRNMLDALFVVGDSGLNIRSGQACNSEKDKQIVKAVFGQGAKDPSKLGKAVYRHYGIAQSGFHVSSCQFALHYFFENKQSLHQFLRNVAECTRLQGYFVGTCYDGMTVFNLLKSKKKEEGITIMKDDYKIFEIIKMYDQTGFPADEVSLGYGINVYQESINKVFREYLVNFEYFTRLMDDYGFILATKEETLHMNVPAPTALFSELFNSMELEIKKDPRSRVNYGNAANMSPEEKQISFMNRYFIFKKVREVNVDKMTKIILNQDEAVEKVEEEVMNDLAKEIAVAEEVPIAASTTTEPQISVGKIRKIKKPKLVLKQVVQTSEPEKE